ncbi:sortilin-like [Watersipora subatra]|uniref:sortilin-like n=1 Tax=Watersipora subatra TaxID=2589382 RepID=UPI00355C5F85
MVTESSLGCFIFHTIFIGYIFVQTTHCYSSSSEQVKLSVDKSIEYIHQTEQLDHRLDKRSTGCNEPGVDLASPSLSISNPFEPPADKTSDFDTISLVWTGEDNSTRLVALMHDYANVNSSVYYSLKGGSFTKCKGLDGLTITIMDRNPTNTKHVLIIGVIGETYSSCISVNSGQEFNCYKMPDNLSPIGSLLFNDDMVMTIMRQDYSYNDQSLVLSVNHGKNWTVIARQVKAALFKAGSRDTIFALTEIGDSSPFAGLFGMPLETQLKVIDVSDFANPTSRDLKGLGKTPVTGFQYVGDMLHVVTEDDDGHKVLKISNDHGESFNDTHLPTTLAGQYINILDTDSKLIFAHVTSAEDGNFGTLYTSGVDGLFYSKSLDRHVSVDFYNVKSMDGVYLSTQIKGDKSLLTLITMDRGAEWKPITVENCGEADCMLQIYGAFLIDEYKKSNSSALAQGPHSSESAKGLIIVQGVLGPSIPYNSGKLSYTYKTPGVFISGDGGYTWKKISDLSGAYHIRVEDSGAVLQALPMNRPLEDIRFSVDEGTCWYSVHLTAVLKDFNVKALVTQPGQKSLQLGIVGHGLRNNSQTTWEILDVDFKKILQNSCTSADMENWDANARCYLGQKRSYQRIKKTSWCYLDSDFNVEPTVEYCTCERDDYQCDYGYVKDAQNNCIKDKKFNNTVTYCLDGNAFSLDSSGYRKLPGDECTPDLSDSMSKYEGGYTTKSLNKSCDQDDLSTYVDIHTVIPKLCHMQTPTPTDNKKGLVAAVVILALISTALCIASSILYCKYTALSRNSLFGQFDDSAWSITSESSSRSVSQPHTEALRINVGEGRGRSYSRLKETGAESDVDLLNM